MENLRKEEMQKIKGGAVALTSSMLNALIRTVSTLYSIGQAVGTAINRAINKNYCS